MQEQKRKLFEEFSPVTTQEWLEKIKSDLKGADFNKKLIWKTYEGFELKPFYRYEDIRDFPHICSLPGDFPWLRGWQTAGNNWLVRQNIEVNDYTLANTKALQLIEKGVNSLGFIINDSLTINYSGIKLLLDGLIPGTTEINIVTEGRALEAVRALIRFIEEKNIDPQSLRGAFEVDPLGRYMTNGILCVSFEEGFNYLARLFDIAGHLKYFRLIQVNASFFSNSGADVVTELAFGLSVGNEYMAALTARNVVPEEAASKIRFSFGLGSNYFFEIAKLRAARMLWSLILSAYGVRDNNATRMEIHCVTGRWNKTIYDPYVNLLRTQTEAMSATLGGTDSLTVEPYDIIFKKPNDFSERIARNQQLLLKEEAHFGKVADPGGGSYYIETLTKLIAENAWKLFTDTEDRGGFLTSLKEGIIQKRIKDCASQRLKSVAERKEVYIGTTQYPDFQEIVSSPDEVESLFLKSSGEGPFEVEPLPVLRATEEIEKLRLIADRAPRKPEVFLLPVGNLAMAMARAQFSGNFFGCGGYKIIDNPAFENIELGINAVLKAEPDMVVLCSSDEEYSVLAPELFNRVGSKAIIVIAGNPPCMEELKTSGIQFFISIRSNLVETLKIFHRLTGLISD